MADTIGDSAATTGSSSEKKVVQRYLNRRDVRSPASRRQTTARAQNLKHLKDLSNSHEINPNQAIFHEKKNIHGANIGKNMKIARSEASSRFAIWKINLISTLHQVLFFDKVAT